MIGPMTVAGDAPPFEDGMDVVDGSVRETLTILARAQALADAVRAEAESQAAAVREEAEQTRRDNLKTFPDFASIDAVPRHGVTVGIETIRAQSRAVGMVVWGEGKREAYRRLATAATYDSDWPATIYSICTNATLYADRSAAGRVE